MPAPTSTGTGSPTAGGGGGGEKAPRARRGARPLVLAVLPALGFLACVRLLLLPSSAPASSIAASLSSSTSSFSSSSLSSSTLPAWSLPPSASRGGSTSRRSAWMLGAAGAGGCEGKVDRWLASLPSFEQEVRLNNNLKQGWDLAFFLHVPRTGGRVLHQCFMRAAVPVSDRCPRAYDKMRLRGEKPCRLLVSHDDYSVVTEALDKHAFATRPRMLVLGHVRDPVSRILSAYEFAVEVSMRSRPRNDINAASWLRHRQAAVRSGTSTWFDLQQRQATTTQRSNNNITTTNNNNTANAPNTAGLSTRSVWPWSILVPFLDEDMRVRAETNNRKNLQQQSNTGSASLDPYDNPHVMSLRDFIRHPLVYELLHNGATLQLLGLTNNSWYDGVKELRDCLAYAPPAVKEQVLDAAKRRLSSLPFVGITEQHANSARLLAHTLGWSLSSPSYQLMPFSISGRQPRMRAFQSSWHQRSDTKMSQVRQPSPVSLGAHYLTCTEQHRSRQRVIPSRKGSSRDQPGLNSQLRFSSETRKKLPEDIIAYIRQANSLDTELHTYATHLFNTRLAAAEEQGLEQLPPMEEVQKLMQRGQSNAPAGTLADRKQALITARPSDVPHLSSLKPDGVMQSNAERAEDVQLLDVVDTQNDDDDPLQSSGDVYDATDAVQTDDATGGGQHQVSVEQHVK
eukprot:jgi/Chlat1/6214/Chrsp44S05748